MTNTSRTYDLKKSGLAFGTGSNMSPSTVILDPPTRYQEMDGFGANEGVIVIASVLDGKVNLMATATDGAQKAGAHAGNLIKAIAGLVGGGGGGRPNMAQAGGKNPAGVDEALAKVAETVESQVR